LIVFAQLNILFFDRIINFIFPNYYFISYHSNTKRITIFSIFLIGFTLIKLTQDWIFLNKKENKDLVQKNEEISNQLYFLRSQINPHFLFNSLNVIYNLSLEKSNETPKAIIQLSDILRYIIYDSETNTVSLKDEVKLIENYIAFQSLRYQLDNYVTFNWTILNEDFKIFPMLFMPFIENCFKHGILDKIEETKINIELIQEENYCLLKLENKYDKPDFKTTNQFSGVGIANVKKNLALVYPKAHELNILNSETHFRVTLKLFDYAN
jgi:LytS/YehU family sensor histidine kinase